MQLMSSNCTQIKGYANKTPQPKPGLKYNMSLFSYFCFVPYKDVREKSIFTSTPFILVHPL